MMGWANSDPGCARSAPTRAPPRHAPRVPKDASFVPLAGARASLTEFLMMAVVDQFVLAAPRTHTTLLVPIASPISARGSRRLMALGTRLR